jgi:hypothetical protein
VAHAGGKGAPAWWFGETVAKAGPRTITALRSANRTAIGKPARTARPTSVDLNSHNNANTEFTLWVVFPRQTTDQDVFLSADGGWWLSESYGHDDSGTQASFVLDRATALRLARALNVPLNERSPLGAGLQATWSIPPTATIRPTDPITVKLRVKNAGTTTVGFVIGGRQRGPRDNRFSFAISRNGTPVAIKDAPDFGGLSYYKALKPGDEHELSVDLRSWADLATPGHYAVDVSYEGELAKDGVMPSTATERKNLWDVKLTGQGGILVQ